MYTNFRTINNIIKFNLNFIKYEKMILLYYTFLH